MASRTHSTPATAGRQANPISRREWWLGVGLVFVALMAHALLPRYEYTAFGPQNPDVIRVDRWTGDHELLFLRGGSLQLPF